GTDPERKQNVAGNEVIVINIFLSKVSIHQASESGEVGRHGVELDEPLVIRLPFLLAYHGRYRELGDMQAGFFRCFQQAVFHLFAYNMFAKCGNEMFRPSGDDKTIRIHRGKAYHIPDAIAPETGIGAYHEGIILARFNVLEGESRRVLFADLGGGNEFKKDAAVRVKQKPLFVAYVLK